MEQKSEIDAKIEEIRKIGFWLSVQQLSLHDLEEALASEKSLVSQIQAEQQKNDKLALDYHAISQAAIQATGLYRTKVEALEAANKILREALEETRCRCSKAVDAHCPECGSDLRCVRNDSALNDEQFDSLKAGEWYCEACKDPTIKSGHKYYWDRELPTVIYQQCGRCAALGKEKANV